jgi:hypothetical protein
VPDRSPSSSGPRRPARPLRRWPSDSGRVTPLPAPANDNRPPLRRRLPSLVAAVLIISAAALIVLIG